MDVLLNSPCLLFHFLTQLVEGQVLDKVKLYLLRQTLSSRQKCSISTFRDKKMTYFNVLCPKKMSNFNVLPQREGNTEMKFSLSLFLSRAPFPHSLSISSQFPIFFSISSFSLHFLAAQLQGCNNFCSPALKRY